ncbi:MAG: OsmC family protein [Gemmatimonadaceae bacterium]
MSAPDMTAGAEGGQDEGGQWVSIYIDRSRYHTVARSRAHAQTLDEPVEVGGTDTAPTPYEALLGALGGCTAITLRMYADRKGWPLEGAHVRLRTASVHAPDCEACATEAVGPHRIERRIELEGPLSDEQRRRLLQIAERCPVKQTLERGVRVVEESR